MRKAFLFAGVLFISKLTFAQVGIGATNPHSSARLQVDASATTNAKGFLPPRVTFAQRVDITSPAQGLVVFCTDCGDNGQLQVFNGSSWTDAVGGTASQSATTFICGASVVTFTYRNSTVTYGTVRGANNTCWLDRNLGATRVATSSTDAAGYGDYFQWGRGDDGHQLNGGTITETLSASNNPGHSKFIISTGDEQGFPNDWRTPQNDNLWQGVNGVNNPCPAGWRIPTSAELDNERASWSSQNAAGAFGSALKFSMPGFRPYYNGELISGGVSAYYWSSTVGDYVYDPGQPSQIVKRGSSVLKFSSTTPPAFTDIEARGSGFSVRCINVIANSNPVSIGQSIYGGKVAYIFQPGDPGYVAGEVHGLIASNSDLTAYARWGCTGTLLSGASGTTLLTGNQNTLDIVAGCGESGIAAKLCADYAITTNGVTYNDWWLPSINELEKLYSNRALIGGFNAATVDYWSSSQGNDIFAYVLRSTTGGVSVTNKIGGDNGIAVRAVRSF
jgi:hypothetical protein